MEEVVEEVMEEAGGHGRRVCHMPATHCRSLAERSIWTEGSVQVTEYHSLHNPATKYKFQQLLWDLYSCSA